MNNKNIKKNTTNNLNIHDKIFLNHEIKFDLIIPKCFKIKLD